GIFNKGFVRAYARFLGLDEEQIVGDFEEAWNAYEAERTPQVLPVPEEEAKPSSSGWGWISVLVIVCAGLAGWYGYQSMHSPQVVAPQTSQRDVSTSPSASDINQNPPGAQPPSAPASQPVQSGNASQSSTTDKPLQQSKTAASGASTEVSPSKSPASTAAPAKSQPAAIRLQVFARADSWLSVSADGKDLGQGILAAQKTRSIRAQKEVRLKIGNLGGVEISFNGQPVNLDGQPNEVKELTFTAEGLQR
ncbi:MAG TPA: RodZ domain-containing protein, partial [Terriglobales bacterium]|nr:RodZ domain-containing protein [Terriglobales bacterium]